MFGRKLHISQLKIMSQPTEVKWYKIASKIVREHILQKKPQKDKMDGRFFYIFHTHQI